MDSQSTCGASPGEGQPGVAVGIVHTKVAHRARAGQTPPGNPFGNPLHRRDAVGCVYVTDPLSLDAALLPRNQCTEDTPSIFTVQQTDSPLMSLLFSTGGALVISCEAFSPQVCVAE